MCVVVLSVVPCATETYEMLKLALNNVQNSNVVLGFQVQKWGDFNY
jgi:hypothetical protein